MKRILFLASLLLMSMGIFAQEVITLTFTAKQNNNNYQQLDSVVVTNLTKDWTEVIYYPDTLLLMNTVGITDWENSKGSVKLYQNIPNPFHGITDFNLTLANKEKVELAIFDINGKKVAEYHNTLPSGEHTFRATMNTPQTYLLSAVTKNGNTSIKMINLSNTGAQVHIEYVSSKPLDMDMTKKQSQNPFSKGDNMKYVGYATQNDGSHNDTKTQVQQGSETITFTFPTEKFDPIVQAFTDEATEIALTSATVNGHYNVVYTDVEELGFEYKKSTDTEFESVYVSNKKTPFSYNLKSLESGTEYLFKAFVKANSTVVYGDVLRFTTEKIKETKIFTGDATDITKRGATLHGSYELGNEELMMLGFEYKEKGTESWKQIISSEKDTPFEAKIENQLEPETEYLYRAFGIKSVDYAQINGEEKSFTTAEKSPELPSVTTVKSETGSYNDMAAKLFGTLESDGFCEMKEVGFLLGKDENPKDNGTKVSVKLGEDKNYSFETDFLEPATTYYFVAFATNEQGTAYGEVKSFKTREAKALPEVVINDIVAYSDNATVSSEITVSEEAVTERGLCYSLTGDPTIADYKVTDLFKGTGTFSLKMRTLVENKEYNVRAYAISWAGIAYSATKTFTTPKLTKPEVSTDSVFKVFVNRATVASSLTLQGGSSNIQVGVVLSKDNKLPTIENDIFYSGRLINNIFTIETGNLENATKYYVRAYAKNDVGEAYGNVLEFTTKVKYDCGDLIEDIEGREYKTVKIGSQCWMQENLRVKTYADGKKFTTGCYDYNDTKYGLGGNTYYNWNTATRQAGGAILTYDTLIQGICPDGWHIPSYSDFHTLCQTIDPGIDISTITVPTIENSYQEIASDNHLSVKLCKAHANWAVVSGTPNMGSPAWAIANDSSEFNLSGFCALPFGYAQNLTQANVGPGNICGFVTANSSTKSVSSGRTFGINPSLTAVIHETASTHGWSVRCIKYPDPTRPEVTTNDAAVVTSTTATLSGTIDFDGRSDIMERGFYYSTDTAVLKGTKVVADNSNNNFLATISELEPSTRYYFMAYATNAEGIGYGEKMQFKTNRPAILAKLQVNGTRTVNATYVDMICEVVDDGGETVVERGVCWATSAAPEIDSIAKNYVADGGIGEGEYVVRVDSVKSGNTYFFRAYANTLKGIAYSEDYELTIPYPTVPTIKIDSIFKITDKSSRIAVTIESTGNMDIITTGVVIDTFANPALGGNAVDIDPNVSSDSFVANAENLKPGYKYYVRAYAKNAVGLVYSAEETFITNTEPSAENTDCGKVVDIDNNEYETVIIGSDCWMKEDLRVKHTPSGDELVLKQSIPTNNVKFDGKAYYEGTSAETGDVILYSYFAACNVTDRTTVVEGCQGICPDGWHVSTHEEWSAVERKAGMSETDITKAYLYRNRPNNRGEIARTLCVQGKWKENDQAAGNEIAPGYSRDDSPMAYNTLGFSAVAKAVVLTGSMEQFGERNSWWTSSFIKGYPSCREIYTHYTFIDYYYSNQETGALCPNTGRSIRCVKNLSPELPVVITNNCTEITASTAAISGKVTFNGRLDILEKGFYLSKSENVKADGVKLIVEDNADAFELTLSELDPKTTYYYAAFAKNDVGGTLGEVKSFTTLDAAVLATIKIVDTDELRASSVKVNCEVVEDGGEPVTERGLCWGKAENPTIENSVLKDAQVGVGSYAFLVKDLTPTNTYYFRAYAITIKGIAYSENVVISTPEGKLPVVTTDSLTFISSKHATILAMIRDNGNYGITDCGVLIDSVSNSSKARTFKATSITRNFITEVAGLVPLTTYYVKAFATNEMGTSYGQELVFKTDSGFICAGTISDIDGNTYGIVQIGDQCWMKEDLRTKTMPDGTRIEPYPENRVPGNHTTDFSEGYWYFAQKDNVVGDAVYYPLSTASNGTTSKVQDAKIQGVCPNGWCLPTYHDFAIMFNYIDPDISATKNYNGPTDVPSNNKLAIKLSLPQSESHWLSYTGPGYVGPNDHTMAGGYDYTNTPNSPGYNFPEYEDKDFNESGFSAKAKGYLYRKDGQFHFNGKLALWTCSSTVSATSPIAVRMGAEGTGFSFITYLDFGTDFYPVRCIRDDSGH